ncbi:MAG: M20 family metallopeptidase [Monoglobaceae bacterium]
MTSEELLKEAQNYQDKIVEDRRYLHMHPGTGFDISEAVEYVKQELSEIGCEPQQCGRAGVCAIIGGKKNGKVFMLRADMDALPIKEESGVDFSSENGNMHACGHDMHTAMLLGAARLLKAHENEIDGMVKLMFQPAEEIFEGSNDMIEAGVLDNPMVDAALMIHVMAGMPFEPGTVIVSSPGVSAPAADYFEIKVKGNGCHGSMPNMGVDPITVAAHILISLQEIHARELALSDKAVLTIGTINAGTAANAIPDTAVMGGSIRTFDEEVRTYLKERLTDISKLTAKTFRADAEVTFGSGCPTLLNDTEVSASVEGYMKELLGNKAFTSAQLSAMQGASKTSKTAGSEDFAYISQRVPSVMIALAAGQPDMGYKYPQHHPMVKFDERVLSVGSAVYAYSALKWLAEHK